jgi:hypothetical protein
MFASLTTKQADRITDILSGTGPAGRARKAVTRFRKDPSKANEASALTLLNGLEKNTQAELRSGARI